MEKYKTRTLEKKLNSIIGEFPVIMITGPRQVGKTTLLEFIQEKNKKNINYVTLDDVMLKNQARQDPELFLRNYEEPLIIDEFQKAPELLPYIKIRVDEKRKKYLFNNEKEVGTMYYLTGSQVFHTMEDASESLAGRVAILDLYGFSIREIESIEEQEFIPDVNMLKKKETVPRLSTPKIFERIINGSYPELNLHKKIDREIFYKAYINTYMERDIRELLKVKDENKFMKFIRSVAARTGCEYNASDLANDVEIDAKTVDEWISILKNTHLIYMLESYSNNNVQKIIKRPKMYFMDTGLACYLTGYLNAETLERSAYNGQIFETYVISEIIKSYTNNGKDPMGRFYYYRDRNGYEIDLLILEENKIYPIEIKKSANPGIGAFKNFDIVKKFKLEVGNGIVLCMISNIFRVDENNYYVPIEYI